MGIGHRALGVGLLVVEACLAALGVLVHYGLTAEYGDINDSALEGLGSGFSAGVGGVALVLVGAAAVAAVLVSSRPLVRLTAVAIPVLMVLGMLVVTPAALGKKLEVQYDATPQCGESQDMGVGPGLDAVRESQEAFDSVEHVGYFGGGGGEGVGGCFRPFVLIEDVDVLQHYLSVLPSAGWRVVEDNGQHMRAERDGMAFEVVLCNGGGMVWAGTVVDPGGARCDQQ